MKVKKDGVFINQFLTELEEKDWISRRIKECLNEGVKPSEIAIISRKHKELEDIVPHLNHHQIPIHYERGQNVLEKDYIKQIITILTFIYSLNHSNQEEYEYLLPEILSYPFWELDSSEIYKISTDTAYGYQITGPKKPTWLENVVKSKNQKIKRIGVFLIDLGKTKHSFTAEQLLDKILGVNNLIYQPEDTNEENEDENNNKTHDFISPYKSYYFDRPYKSENSEYFNFLSNLKTFIKAIRDYKKKSQIYLEDILEYVSLMNINNIQLIDNSVYNSKSEAVNLLTAHKAKGLEFEYVFIINCLEKVWNQNKKTQNLRPPINLSLLPEKENDDDSIRLFFVAATRAKKYLCFTCTTHNSEGKELEKLSFLDGFELQSDDFIDKDTDKNNILEYWIKTEITAPGLTTKEKVFLEPILENYKLSVTHLNNFLDITKGGPQRFLELNLLRFPQSKNASAGYGTAMHATIAQIYNIFKQEKTIPSKDRIQDIYTNLLGLQRLTKTDFIQYLDRGLKNLDQYIQNNHQYFSLNDMIEVDFNYQSVVLNEAKITGKIDKMIITDDSEVVVIDFKTGKASEDWKPKSEYDKIKLDNYHRQLIFYKLLVENSRDYSGKFTVNQGRLEFLESHNTRGKNIFLDTYITSNEAKKLEELIQAVYHRIMKYDFSLPREYSENFNGIQQFIIDLLQN